MNKVTKASKQPARKSRYLAREIDSQIIPVIIPDSDHPFSVLISRMSTMINSKFSNYFRRRFKTYPKDKGPNKERKKEKRDTCLVKGT